MIAAILRKLSQISEKDHWLEVAQVGATFLEINLGSGGGPKQSCIFPFDRCGPIFKRASKASFEDLLRKTLAQLGVGGEISTYRGKVRIFQGRVSRRRSSRKGLGHVGEYMQPQVDIQDKEAAAKGIH